MLLCVAMVVSVSPSWVRVTPNRFSSSLVSDFASTLAAAVMAAFLFGEIPAVLQILGGALILGATLLNELQFPARKK